MVNYKKVASLELSQRILEKGYSVRIPVVGGSMFPLLRSGNTIIFEPMEVSKISIGDIIVYGRGRRIVAHRLVKGYQENGRVVLVTKGDSSSSLDPSIYAEDVLGKVVSVERKGCRIRLDKGIGSLIDFICARIFPFSSWIYPVLRKVKYVLGLEYRDSNRRE